MPRQSISNFLPQNLFSQPKRLTLHEVLRGKAFSSHTGGLVTLLGKTPNTSLKKCLMMRYSAMSKTSLLLTSHQAMTATDIHTLPDFVSYKPALSFAYLSGTDDGFASPVATSNHHLLGKEDFFSRDLNSQVTTGHHNAITGLHDLIKPESKRRGLLNHLFDNTPSHLFCPPPLKGSIALECDTQQHCWHTAFPCDILVPCNTKVG